MWAILLFGGITALFVFMTLGRMFHIRWAQRLPQLDGAPKPVRCSVVIAARDEEDRIEATVQRLLTQQHLDLEIIIVNDRSSDRTRKILHELEQKNPSLRALHVKTLPEGWLGKCHACHLGAQAATGDWILFTDADCWMKPDTIARALTVAEREAADHITLTPGVAPETAAASAWHLAFLVTMLDWISGVNRDSPKRFLGIGAFNLVRASAYRECGGYEALRLTVLDDVKLGLLLRRAGKRTRAFIGGDDVECHWGTTLGNMIKIMEKNYFAALDYRVIPAALASIGGLLLWIVTFLGPFIGGTWGMVAFAALLTVILPAAIIARGLRWPVTTALLTPFAFPILFYAILNSMIVTLRQGGIRWRDTFYSLKMLRDGNVR